jgi:hypothetical protein
MMAAQVALNYGLFCEEIVFVGRFDKHDQRFIQDMARNTAREIYVKKFLEPNPFVRGEAATASPLKKERYLRAELIFQRDDTDSKTLQKPAGRIRKGRHPVTRYFPAEEKTAC